MSGSALVDLPDEIVSTIIGHLEIPSLLALNRTCKRFISITGEPLVWKNYCQNHFRYWNSRRKFQDRLAANTSAASSPATTYSDNDWKEVYKHRTNNMRAVTARLDDIINGEPVDRCSKIDAIVNQGYQVKDALIRAFYRAHLSKSHLAQRYWSHIVLGSLHRSIALEQWQKLRFRSDVENPIETALAALDLFVLDQRRDGDMDDIFTKLNAYAESVRRTHPDIDEKTPRQKAILIAAHLRAKKWVDMENQNDYHNLDHIFLGVALFSPGNNCLPLISCVIYTYVCRQFDLRATPCNFPERVHAVIQPPPGMDLDGNVLEPSLSEPSDLSDATAMWMDPFETDEPILLSTLTARALFLDPHFTAAQIQLLVVPASARMMLERTAKNILHHTPSASDPPISGNAAIYGAGYALCTFPSRPAALHEFIINLTQMFHQHFDQDLQLFREYILPLTATMPNHLAYRHLINQLVTADSEPPTPKLRLTSNHPNIQQPRHKIGQVFRHLRHSYVAVIYGWDTHCNMEPYWISMNRVDDLSRGRTQPFYNAFVAGDHTTRYVAEENIQVIGQINENGEGTRMTEADVEAFGIEVGKWFKRFDHEQGCFISNIRRAYPQD